MINIAIDAMGGDNAPDAVLKGVKSAVKKRNDIKITLFGPKALIEERMEKMKMSKESIQIVDAPGIISLHENPVMAVRRKKDSSIVMGLKYLKEGKLDGFISAGSSGAILAGGQLIVGCCDRSLKRAPLAAFIPTTNGVSLLLDCGANVDPDPFWLKQFADIGTIYVKEILGIENPTLGIVNIGAEEEKGNKLVRETMKLLKEDEFINFKGSIEARDIPSSNCDIILTDAFTGNVVLKLYEGLGSTFLKLLKAGLKKNLLSKIGALLSIKSLKEKFSVFDATQYGGAPLLGLNALVVKVHGNTKGSEIEHAIYQVASFIEKDLAGKIKENLTK